MTDGLTSSSQVQDTMGTASLAAALTQDVADAGAARVVVERPPPGLQRGEYAWPAWGIGLLGSVIVISGLGYLVWRFWRRPPKDRP